MYIELNNFHQFKELSLSINIVIQAEIISAVMA